MAAGARTQKAGLHYGYNRVVRTMVTNYRMMCGTHNSGLPNGIF